MAEKLSITIALEGGKQIEQQLAEIGKAGQQAFADIARAAEQAGGFKNLKPEEVTAKLKDMGIVGTDAFNSIQQAVAGATRLEQFVGIVQKVENGFSGLAASAVSFARALGPIGAVAAVVGGALAKMGSDAAAAIQHADTEAIKLGMSIEKFDGLKQGFEKMGVAAGTIAGGIANVNSEIEKLNVERVTKAFKELQEGATRGFGGIGTEQLNLLIETAGRVGPAAAAARQALEKLGVPIPAEASSALERLGISATNAASVIPEFIEKMRQLPDTAQRTQDAISVLGQNVGIQFVQALRTGGVAVDQFKSSLSGLDQEQANKANAIEQQWNRVGAAWERLKTTLGSGLLANVPDNLISTMQTIENLLNPAKWAEWGSAGLQAFVDILASIGELEVKIAEFIAKLSGDIWSAFKSTGTSAINAVIGVIDSLIEKIKEAVRALGNLFTKSAEKGGSTGAPSATPGNARGGLIGGRGTGTSDSNLSWVSRGEHIMPARAVSQPGVLAFLEALRRSGGDLRRVMDGMGRFATGGLVSMPSLASATGGGMPHLGTVDLRTDHGSARLMASSSAMEQLSRLAVTKRMTSTGRKPGFIG